MTKKNYNYKHVLTPCQPPKCNIMVMAGSLFFGFHVAKDGVIKLEIYGHLSLLARVLGCHSTTLLPSLHKTLSTIAPKHPFFMRSLLKSFSTVEHSKCLKCRLAHHPSAHATPSAITLKHPCFSCPLPVSSSTVEHSRHLECRCSHFLST